VLDARPLTRGRSGGDDDADAGPRHSWHHGKGRGLRR
jgi:hypothetical protein